MDRPLVCYFLLLCCYGITRGIQPGDGKSFSSGTNIICPATFTASGALAGTSSHTTYGLPSETAYRGNGAAYLSLLRDRMKQREEASSSSVESCTGGNIKPSYTHSKSKVRDAVPRSSPREKSTEEWLPQLVRSSRTLNKGFKDWVRTASGGSLFSMSNSPVARKVSTIVYMVLDSGSSASVFESSGGETSSVPPDTSSGSVYGWFDDDFLKTDVAFGEKIVCGAYSKNSGLSLTERPRYNRRSINGQAKSECRNHLSLSEPMNTENVSTTCASSKRRFLRPWKKYHNTKSGNKKDKKSFFSCGCF